MRAPESFENRWETMALPSLGWDALALARRMDVVYWEGVLDEVDGLLLRLLDRLPMLERKSGVAARALRTFRLPEIERLQHATAAALVGQRYGAAGLRAVVADAGAPLGRRYYAFLALGERHPPTAWPSFARYLTPEAHHAFLGVAAEAARFYPDSDAASRLTDLFDNVRTDLHLRTFLSPRILESLFVLNDPGTLPFFEDLLVLGHTDADPERCEVTRALVMVRRFTGTLAPNTKFADPDDKLVPTVLDQAEATFERYRDVLRPVAVI